MPRLLLIAGSGRNSGKTTLACQLINKFSATKSIIAVKISPHFHKIQTTNETILNTDDLIIFNETNPIAAKDSSKMLAAGARKSYFVMTERNNAGRAFNELIPYITEHDFIICESGGLRNFVEPGLFLLMQNAVQDEHKPEFEKMKELADQVISFNNGSLNFDINSIIISENRWKIKDFIV